MAGETIITIIGNLTADPEVRATQNGGRVANVTIASTPRQYNRTSGQWEDGDALFLRCSAWDSQHQPLASNMQASLSKGMRVIAQGRLVQRSYQDRDSNNRTVVELRLDEIGPALTRGIAQVTRNNNSGGGNQGGDAGFGGQSAWGGGASQAPAPQGQYAPGPAGSQTGSPAQDPWVGGGNDEPEF